MKHGIPLAAVLFLVLLASCSLPRPSVGLAIAGTDVPGSREGSYCQTGGCSSYCADGPAPVAPVTVVHVGAPIRLDFSAGGDVTTIHGDIWRGETMSGQPVESFDLGSGQRSYTAKAMTAGRYYILVGLQWSRPLDRGDSGLAFSVEIIPP
jgi:hypothetical protein